MGYREFIQTLTSLLVVGATVPIGCSMPSSTNPARNEAAKTFLVQNGFEFERFSLTGGARNEEGYLQVSGYIQNLQAVPEGFQVLIPLNVPVEGNCHPEEIIPGAEETKMLVCDELSAPFTGPMATQKLKDTPHIIILPSSGN